MTMTAPANKQKKAADLVQVMLDRAKPLLVQVFIFSIIINMLVLTSSIYMMQVFDRVMSSQSVATLLYLTLIAVFALGLMSALDLVRARILTRIGTWLEASLGSEALRRAVDASLLGQSYRTEALRDLGTLRNFMGGSGILTLFDIIPALMFFIIIYAFHPMLGHIALLGALVLLAIAVVNDRVTHGPIREANNKAQLALRQADSAMQHAEALDVMGMTPGLISRWRASSTEVLKLQTTASDRGATASAVSKFIRLLLQIAVLGVGAYLVLLREMTAGQMMASSIIMSRALSPVEQSIGTWRHVISALEAKKRLHEMLSRPLLRADSMQLPAPKGLLAAEGVSYMPPQSKTPILRGISFSLPPGSVTAIVGPSAAGKSTLARLCVGAYAPTYGNMRLDGADVYLWERQDFGRHVGYLPQNVELFAGTVRDNIARLQQAEPSEVVEAAQIAGAHEMILRLPQGYETEIGDSGSLLSGGQRQRIGLARALFRKPQLVVLDEPNSSLDAEGEEALNGAIGRMKALGATIVLIGHRPSILAHVDTLMVLRDGHIEMMGPRDEIAQRIMPKPPQRVAAGRAAAVTEGGAA